MMRLTIITSDSAVYIDSICKMPLDLSGCDIPLNVHALQWFDTKGWIEFKDDGDPFTTKPDNLIVEVLPDWANACIQMWQNWVPPVHEEVSDILV